MSHDVPDNPLVTRYAGRAMTALWSPASRYGTWRRLWVALAEAEHALGLEVTEVQVEAMRTHVDDIDFDRVTEYERTFRHDVMAHVHAFGDVAPEARAIIHLGATSCFVTDNADMILIRDALTFVRDKLVETIVLMADFAVRWKDQPCLGYTHYQPAQLVTVGKRASLWALELVQDLEEVEHRLSSLVPLGVKGATGTQASFLALFDGDASKVEQLDRLVMKQFGFDGSVAVSGQTYSRKVDARVLSSLGAIGESAHRFGTDLRLLAHDRELEEPFESNQIGSSAMAYKRNPMRAERMCSLGRYVMGLPMMLAQTAATQWMERTLDDSAIRRLAIPQAFLAIDALLNLYRNVVDGLVVNTAVIDRRVRDELPFLATENLMMAAVRAGGDRQEVHERVRVHAQEAARLIKEGRPHDLLDRLRDDPAFARVDLDEALDPSAYIGLAAHQVERFVNEVVVPLQARYAEQSGSSTTSRCEPDGDAIRV